MKNVAAIIILLSSLIFAGADNERNNTADSFPPDSTNSGLKPSYSFGVILGELGGLTPKLIIGNNFSGKELQVHGMYWGSHYHLGMDFNYVVFKNENFTHSVGLGGGIEKGYEMEQNKFIGYGISPFGDLFSAFAKINYSFKWSFLFLQVGTAIGSGNYSVPRFKSQLGFMYNF